MYSENWTTTEEIADEFRCWQDSYAGTYHRTQKRTKAEAKRALIVFCDLALFEDYRDIKPALRRHFIDLFMESETDSTMHEFAIKEGEKESKEIVHYYTSFIDD